MISASARLLLALLRVVDRQRRQRADLGPPVLGLARDLERAPPDRFGLVEPSRVHGTQPWNRSERATAHGSSSRSAAASDRASSSSAASRSASTLIAMSPRNRSAIASVQSSSNAVPSSIARSSDLRRLGVFGEPVPRLADTCERTGLADAPGVLRSGERERAQVEVHRRPALQTPPGAIARRDQGVERAVRGLPVRRVQVARSERGSLEMIGGPRQRAGLLQALGDHVCDR